MLYDREFKIGLSRLCFWDAVCLSVFLSECVFELRLGLNRIKDFPHFKDFLIPWLIYNLNNSYMEWNFMLFYLKFYFQYMLTHE